MDQLKKNQELILKLQEENEKILKNQERIRKKEKLLKKKKLLKKQMKKIQEELINLDTDSESDSESESESEQELEIKNNCCICMEDIDNVDLYKTNCNHTFHSHCILQWGEHKKNCPMCRAELKRKSNKFMDNYIILDAVNKLNKNDIFLYNANLDCELYIVTNKGKQKISYKRIIPIKNLNGSKYYNIKNYELGKKSLYLNLNRTSDFICKFKDANFEGEELIF